MNTYFRIIQELQVVVKAPGTSKMMTFLQLVVFYPHDPNVNQKRREENRRRKEGRGSQNCVGLAGADENPKWGKKETVSKCTENMEPCKVVVSSEPL